MNRKNMECVGSSFDDFLADSALLECVTAMAHKRVLAFQIKQAMEQKHMTKTAMAEKMHTSRSAVDRLLNPDNPSVTLDTIDRAASALGLKLNISLV